MASAQQGTGSPGPSGNARNTTGMRREWNFTLHLCHQSARSKILYAPQWTNLFIDPKDIANLEKLDRDVRHCPMQPFLSFEDKTSADSAIELWEQVPKYVTLFYSFIPASMKLEEYCKRSVQHVLGDPRVESVDGVTTLHRLVLGPATVPNA